MKFALSTVIALCAAAFAANNAPAQPYPSRPIRLIVPFTPGGTTDTPQVLSSAGASPAIHYGALSKHLHGKNVYYQH